jgi:hypothetical protein
MSYVRQDTAVQPAPAAAAAAAGGSAATAPLVAAQAADSAQGATGAGSTQLTAAEVIPVITFLYKLAEGAADESFGLNVAQVWTQWLLDT